MADDSSSSAVSDNEEQKQEKTTIAEDIVVTKYKMAAEITNRKCVGRLESGGSKSGRLVVHSF